VSFATITFCVSSQQVFIVVYFFIDSVWKLLVTPLYPHQLTCYWINKKACGIVCIYMLVT